MYNKKLLFGVMLSGLVLVNLTGCGKEKINEQVKSGVDDDIYENIEQNDLNKQADNNAQSINIQQIEQKEESSQSKLDDQVKSISNDEIIIDYFNNATDEINNFLESETVSNAKEKCKEYFITFVDFIFYDGQIKNITFSELKDETKDYVIEITQKLDNLIMKKFPDYKENISATSQNLYEKASDLLNSGKEKVNDYIESKIGEENYQNVLDNIDKINENDKENWNDVKEKANDLYESGKEKVKNWYENFRGN